MNPEEIAKLADQLSQARTEVIALVKSQDEEIAKYGESTSKTADAIVKTEARMDEIATLLADANARLDAFEADKNRLAMEANASKTYGEIFTSSEQYKDMIRRRSGNSEPIVVGSFFNEASKRQMYALETSGYPSTARREPGIMSPLVRPLTIRDLIPVGRTDSMTIEWVQETGFAAENESPGTQTHGAAAVVNETDDKPEAKIEFELVDETMRVIAHWIPATRQILSDEPQLRGYIDQRLMYGLAYAEENQILYGSGNAGNIQGIMTHPDVQTYAISDGPASDTKIDAIRRAMTLAQVAQVGVQGIVMNPQDWEDVELAKGDDYHYIRATAPDSQGVDRLWRIPVLVTTAVNAGEALVGAFSLGCKLWDREDSTIRVAEQHAEFFTKNMVAILAEERIGLAIYRPEAFVVVTLEGS